MSRLYDAAEPGVIDEDLLHTLVIEQGPQKEAGRIAISEGIDFSEVLQLRLDFKNIQQVENLWQFSNLRKLQLDNNIISDIKGLENLVHLEWLDLSFNNIREVQGLETLTNLKDLSLAHNLIHHVSGLDTLCNLQVLSLGYNELNELEDTVLYLRQFPTLKTLCLKGNEFSPVSEHAEVERFRRYQLFCVAILPNLAYLDYQTITKEARSTACEEHQEYLLELVAREKQETIKREEEMKKAGWLQLLTTAYMNGIEGEEFYESLFEEDADATKLALIPGEKERLDKYHDTVIKTADEILKIGLAEKERREKDREAFFTAHRTALEYNQQQSIERIQLFEREKAELLNSNKAESLEGKISELQYDLMKLEMILVEQLDDIIKEFDRSYNEMVGSFIEKIQAQTTQLRELEKERHEKLTEDVTKLLDAYSKGQLEEELSEEVILLLSDKDSLMGALNASHDAHMLAIDNKEDSIRLRAQKDSKTLMEQLFDKEGSRNRQRVTEIKHYIELQQDELEDWLNADVNSEQ